MFMVALGFSSAVVYYEFGLEKNIKITRASASDNVSGWAWNANIGWISFNCTGDTPACGASDYGVSINLTTGYFSGYAWSSGVGWISFNRSDTGDPPANPYKNGSGPIAMYDFLAPNQVTGWAKILSLGDNGWIKLRKSIGGEPDYGVSINPATGDFSGWAWNANSDESGIGWISFNCANESSACSGTNYKVVGKINRPPTAINLTAPNWNYLEAAGASGALNANLNFDFVDIDGGSSGSAYQIIITKADDTPVLDTGVCTGYDTPAATPVKCKLYIDICMKYNPPGCIKSGDCVCQFPLTQTDGIWYGTGYKWSVQVWDNYDAASAITPYSTNPDYPLVVDDQVVPTFTTYKHKFPKPFATLFPLNPSRGEKVKFTDTSQRFFSADPTAEVACTSATCDWLWTAPGASITGGTTATPIIIFNSAGMNSVTLKVTDETDTGSTPYYTTINIDVDVNAKLPGWREVKPE